MHNNIGIISLNRPERMNAVSEEMYREVGNLLDEFDADDAVRVVIITGSVRIKDGVENRPSAPAPI